MSAQKRGWDGNGSGSSRSKKKPNITDEEALEIFHIHPNFRPYAILNRFVKDKETNELVELKNDEKTRELLDFLLNMGNANSFKVKTIKEAEEAIDMVFVV